MIRYTSPEYITGFMILSFVILVIYFCFRMKYYKNKDGSLDPMHWSVNILVSIFGNWPLMIIFGGYLTYVEGKNTIECANKSSSEYIIDFKPFYIGVDNRCEDE